MLYSAPRIVKASSYASLWCFNIIPFDYVFGVYDIFDIL